jgi:hypothetical protein
MLALMRVPVAIVSVIAITITILLGPGIVSSLGASGSAGTFCSGSEVGSRSGASGADRGAGVAGFEYGGGAGVAKFGDFIRRQLVNGEVGNRVWPGPPYPIKWKCRSV